MDSTTDDIAYYEYLKGRRWTGRIYHRFFLYPRLAKHLSGQVIDIGCGLGDFLAYRVKTVGVDISEKNVEHCLHRGLEAYVFQNNRLPFNKASFDGALLDNVLEHIENPDPLLLEIRRVLKKGGSLLVGVPGHKGFGYDPDHKIYYDRERLIRTIRPYGFEERRHFYTPFRSTYFENRLRQYCLYSIFSLSGH